MNAIVATMPWIGLAVGLLGFLIRAPKGEGDAPLATALRAALPSLLVAVAALVASFFLFGETRTALHFVCAGSVVGSLLGVAATWSGQSATGALVTALGLTAFLVGTKLPYVSLTEDTSFAGLVVGLAAGSLPALVVRRSTAHLTALLVFVGGLATLLAHMAARRALGEQATELAVWSALLALGLQWAAARATEGKRAWIGPAVGVVAMAVLAWLAFSVYLGERPLAIVAVVGVLAALVTVWCVRPESPTVLSWGIAALLWLGVATFAFSQKQGLGMATTALFGMATFLLLDRRDLLPSAGLVAGLAFYRLFREGNELIVEPFDIGQHYSMVGFLVGVVVGVGVVDAVRNAAKARAATGALVALLGALVVVGAVAFFGNKGAIGLVVGLGASPLVARLAPGATGWSVVAAAAMQCVALVAYGPLVDQKTFERDEKVRLLVILAVVGLLLVGALVLVQRERKAVARADA